MKRTWLRLLAVIFAFALVAAACGDDDDDTGATDGTEETPAEDGAAATEEATEEATDGEAATEEAADGAAPAGLEGTTVTVFGPESSEEEAGALQDALNVFGEETGIDIVYTGDSGAEGNLNSQVEAGTPPDIFIFPQPGKLAGFADSGDVLALPEDVAAAVGENWPESWTQFGNVGGTQYGVPIKADLKSLVWYQPAVFEAKGYAVPETYDAFLALVDEMIANGDTPLCVGIESDTATGWPFTDWVEELVLRQQGPEYYDTWVNHEIPFNSPEIVDIFTQIGELWNKEGAVFASSGSIATTSFQANGEPLVAGDCLMHRQASFYAAFIPEGTPFADGTEGAVDVFYFPANEGAPVLGAGTLAGAFADRPEVWAVMEYLSTARYAETRQAAQTERKGGGLSGFLSAANGQDLSVYQPLEQSFLDILSSADVVRFDGSDLMPAEIGTGAFWTEGTAFVNGDEDAQTAADNIEAAWPAG